MAHPIKFYGHTKPFGYFSNFYDAPIVIDGKKWPTTEHYFQALKFNDLNYQETIRLAKNPKKSKSLGQTRKVKLRSDWEEVKEDIMFKSCFAKFTQHKDLKRLLLETGDAKLIEHTANDRYWGDGGDGRGKNRLGVVLMKVRDAIRRGSESDETTSSSHSKAQLASCVGDDNDDDDDDDADDDADAVHGNEDSELASMSKKPKSQSKESLITFKTGDLMKATEQCIAHQCNAVTTYAKGLSKVVFQKYPGANIYKQLHREKKSTPGTLSVHHCGQHTVINMIAQRSPGRPNAKETSQMRLQWFKQCLADIGKLRDISSIAFPYMIGCGLAGGSWADYKVALDDFARAHSHIRVAVYKLPSA